MKYDLTMLHGRADLDEFAEHFCLKINALNRLAFIADKTEQIVFYVDAVEDTDQAVKTAAENRAVMPDFELIVMLRPRSGGEMEEYTKQVSSFLSAVGELDRVYRRFLTATEMIGLADDGVPVAVFNILRGLLIGMGIRKLQ